MSETSMQLPHKITLNERKNLVITGVTEVISYDEVLIRLKTALGELRIEGTDLNLKNLNLESGQAAVEGKICGLIYDEPGTGGGFWHRFLG